MLRSDQREWLNRLFDCRTPDEKGMALVKWDADFAAFQRQSQQRLWDRLREAIKP